MIVVMKPGATDAQIQHVIDLVREFGLKDHPIHGTDRTVIACIGDKRAVDKGALENAPMVEKIMPILAPYKMASREVRRERTQINFGPSGAVLGGPKVGVIAGPCSVESREQLLETAHAVKNAGAIALRGGAWKPRTSPYAFQGLHKKGLEILAEAREETGLAIVTEVLSADNLDLVTEYADVLQIGAAQHAALSAPGGGGPLLQAGHPEARTLQHDGGISPGRRIHHQRGQPERDPVRARHSHV